MTVIYTHEVATGSRGFGNFIKLLFRWRGSIYKLVLPDLSVYLVFFYGINFVYRFWLKNLDENDRKREQFEHLVSYCKDISTVIPLQFVLGFYVSQIVTRWWSQFMTIPWPDSLAVIIATGLHGHDDRARMMRRTIVRYLNLCLAMVFTMISPQARSRFPTLEHLVEAGLLLSHEKDIIEHLQEKLEGPKYYVPIVWAGAIASKARKEGRIRDDMTLYHVIKETCKFRKMAGDLLGYDWVCVPLVYTQVVTLATYVYFLACLVGKQTIENVEHTRDGTTRVKVDIYVPIFHFLEFFFLMGWLKVAETMVNPFGEDDDDFEVNWLIDRNLTISYMITDEMNTEFPEMVRDQYFDEVVPEEMFYTETALKYKTEGYLGSALAAVAQNVIQADVESKEGEGSILRSGSFAMSNMRDTATRVGGSVAFVPMHPNRRSKPKSDEELAFDRTFEPKGKDSDEHQIIIHQDKDKT